MKKNRLYFPLENSLPNENEVSKLIEHYGPKGFGTYILILNELRSSNDYQCSLDAIKGLSRRCKITPEVLKRVLYDFNLFEIKQEETKEIISSPYLDRVMRMYDERLEKLSEARKKGLNKVGRNSEGKFTAVNGSLDKIRLDKIKTTTAIAAVVRDEAAVTAADEFKDWEECFDKAMQDESWLEIAGMNSGMGRLFLKHRRSIIESFRQHVILQGKGSRLHSVGDIKSYFANFIRQGTLTQKRVAQQLELLEEELRQTSPYRYETVDPVTGQRSYCGNPIPSDAPPRPNNKTVWSDKIKAWI
jgi:hypothetical protein